MLQSRGRTASYPKQAIVALPNLPVMALNKVQTSVGAREKFVKFYGINRCRNRYMKIVRIFLTKKAQLFSPKICLRIVDLFLNLFKTMIAHLFLPRKSAEKVRTIYVPFRIRNSCSEKCDLFLNLFLVWTEPFLDQKRSENRSYFSEQLFLMRKGT